jgi:hypothetical protein
MKKGSLNDPLMRNDRRIRVRTRGSCLEPLGTLTKRASRKAGPMNADPLRRGVVVVILVLAVGMSWARVSGAAPSGRLEIFSWWTAGGEAQRAVATVLRRR